MGLLVAPKFMRIDKGHLALIAWVRTFIGRQMVSLMFPTICGPVEVLAAVAADVDRRREQSRGSGV